MMLPLPDAKLILDRDYVHSMNAKDYQKRQKFFVFPDFCSHKFEPVVYFSAKRGSAPPQVALKVDFEFSGVELHLNNVLLVD